MKTSTHLIQFASRVMDVFVRRAAAIIIIVGVLSAASCDQKSSNGSLDNSLDDNNSNLSSSLNNSAQSEFNDLSPDTNSLSAKEKQAEIQLSESFLNNTLKAAKNFQQAITSFLQLPNEENFLASKNRWVTAHQHWQEFSLFFSVQHSNPGLFSFLEPFQSSIDAQPIQPGFLDYFSEYTHSGIVNDIALPLTAKNLREQHGITDASDIVLGLHGIEFLLWGEKGDRPVSDFIAATSLSDEQKNAQLSIVDLPNNRRRTLLQLQTQLLVDDLNALQRQWSDAQGIFQRTYFSLPKTSRLQLIRSAGTFYIDHFINTNTEPHNIFSQSDHANLSALLRALQQTFYEASSPFYIQHIDEENSNSSLKKTNDEITKLLSNLNKNSSDQAKNIEQSKLLDDETLTLLQTIHNQLSLAPVIEVSPL